MMEQLIDAIGHSADKKMAGIDWPRHIRTFLSGIDSDLEKGIHALELGVENRPVLKITLLPRLPFTTAHLENLPWLDSTQRGLIYEIKKVHPKFQYGIKLNEGGVELEIYVCEMKTKHFQRNIFASTRIESIGTPSQLRTFSLTNNRELSSYWEDSLSRGYLQLPAEIKKLAIENDCKPESWIHHIWRENEWGAAKFGVQLVKITAQMDQALRAHLKEVNFLDVFGFPAARTSAQFVSTPTRKCLYMTLNNSTFSSEGKICS